MAVSFLLFCQHAVQAGNAAFEVIDFFQQLLFALANQNSLCLLRQGCAVVRMWQSGKKLRINLDCGHSINSVRFLTECLAQTRQIAAQAVGNETAAITSDTFRVGAEMQITESARGSGPGRAGKRIRQNLCDKFCDKS